MEIRPILSALLRNKTAPLLVALQVAISLAILTNALYIVNVRLAVSQRASGIADESSVLHMDATYIIKHNFNERLALREGMKTALQTIPGVLSVATLNQMPMTRSGEATSVASDRKQSQATAVASYYTTSDSLVATLQLKLLEGRDFTVSDTTDIDPDANPVVPPSVVIVTRALALALYPDGGSVIGKTLLTGTGEGADALRIIGVVERLQSIGAEPGTRGEYSMIVPQSGVYNSEKFAVRTQPGQRDRVIGEAEAVLRKFANEPIIIRSNTADTDRTKRYRKDLAMASMLSLVSALLLLVTASGIVGMSMLWVAQRRKQIGVRRAIGARKWHILRYFIIENMLITSFGIGIGVLLATALNQILVTQLELGKLPLSFLLAGAGLFWLLGIIAVLGPALRAVNISPAVATRSD